MTEANLFNINKVEVEKAFEAMELQHGMFSKTSTSTNEVLQYMLDHTGKIWWWAWEFGGKTNSKGGYLSHRACARASDLAIFHPELVEDRKIGRFKVYRLKVENMQMIRAYLGL